MLCEPTAYWPNKSIKWLKLRFATSFEPNERRTYKLFQHREVTPPALRACCHENEEKLSIDSAFGKLVFSKNTLLAMQLPQVSAKGLSLQTIDKHERHPTLTEFTYQLKHNGKEYLYVDIQQKGMCNIDNHLSLHINCAITVSLKTGEVDCKCTIRNPQAAKHVNGKWDLGDENSSYFKAIHWLIEQNTEHNAEPVQTYIELSDAQKHWRIEKNTPFFLHQASSGEAHWQHPIHVDKDNKITLPFQGYRLQVDKVEHEGAHAKPILHFCRSQGFGSIDAIGTRLSFEDFWQNFPSSVHLRDNTFYVSVLGSALGPQTELQAGEQKTRAWALSPLFHAKARIQTTLDTQYISQTGVIFNHQQESDEEKLQALIKAGLHGNDNFFNKRRKSDSYGWRHFGELHADHETAQHPDIEHFVSHYNNQYDPIYGFLVQWLKTGEHQWFELADALAKHVADIDVYHTELDKPDYSGGLFWHTDHYVQAYTATHRTYSVHQPSNVYDDHAGSGGPGGQHCYTQGLTLHYWLTGYTPSREASLKIAKWIETLYEGDNTLLSLALAVKNRHRSDLKHVFSGKYPLDRGTGNYIQALLDSYELSGRPSAISKVERIICATISASDDISERRFDDVESTWFYTVFLQSVCRYLYLSASSTTEHCAAHHQILSAFLHYVAWMIENEYLYLDKPDILEFPNQTWTAQDLRKVCIVSFASYFLNDALATKANNKAKAWLAGITQRLTHHPEASTTRVLCLMMQNAQINDYAHAGKQVYQHFNTSKAVVSSAVTSEAPELFHSHLIKTLKATSFSKERRSLLRRFPQLSKWLGELNS